MTYGEKRIQRQNSINFKKEIEDITEKLGDTGSLPQRLSEDEAISYYNQKLQKAFASASKKRQEEQPKPKIIMLS
ncbi:hypothetical protein [Sulfurospirillum multivorans]|uniref:Uncharacterized protein n=2 Tax=Sulfurospirillum multivorans TaxID=66821 RepID=A0AA86AM99_SULMK|nr:hypothetical protein [Sulfurospirillum multivorans]AHJ13134.1 hypothetical protein SMUL_1879 [Sulfurospirillum multivorans DSM 12446]QEH06622.1 hypothetical protein SMN_1857 [Sulfurospirillum multivorans]